VNTTTSFIVGETYSNEQIWSTLRLENLGGIRPSLDSNKSLRHLAILTASDGSGKYTSDNPYSDRIEGDVLVYTAQGRTGDQVLAGRNKRLLDQYTWPAPYYGFMNEGRQTYRFLGLLELIRHYQEIQADSKGDLRTVWIFEFKIHSSPSVIPVDEARVISESLICAKQATFKPEERELVDLDRPTPDFDKEADTEVTRRRLLGLDPYRFEELIAQLLIARGFREVAVTRRSGDGGIDVDAFAGGDDYFFSDTHVQLQAKRWRHAIGSVEINSFRGALSTTAKGIFVSTSHFTKAALQEARHPVKPAITLLDGNRLSR
jgi:hypothetical protein